MNRGEVYRTDILLPDRVGQAGRVSTPKFVVVLQGGHAFQNQQDVAVVIASTLRPPGRPLRRYEVGVGTADGFRRDTVIDCRWPYTLVKTEVAAGQHLTTLSPVVMERVNVALVAGLEMT